MKIKFPEIEGCELYLCGGAVRDMIYGTEPKDKDFVVITELSFQELVDKINSMENSKVFQAKEEFFTIRCKVKGELIDITFPRTESGYKDGRRPSVVNRSKTLKEDSTRRDYTMNALYLGSNGAFFDYNHGLTDISLKLLRAVGNANERFEEDYLRIIRAIRFSLKYELTIEKETFKAMKTHAKNVLKIDTDRLRGELNKSMVCNSYMTLIMLNKLELIEGLEKKGLKLRFNTKVKP